MEEPLAAGADVFELERIRSLIELMKEHDLSAVDLRQGRQRIALRRGPQGGPVAMPAYVPQPIAAPPARGPEPGAKPAAETGTFIKSPMVGTFYSRPNPKAAVFVKVGDTVQASTTVCLVEAMKTFNEIPAEVSGRIAAMLVEDGEHVEFGQNLFRVET